MPKMAVVMAFCPIRLTERLPTASIAVGEALFEAPKHPYTQALLAAIPRVSKEARTERIILPGSVPSPINLPSGCPFHPRCFAKVGKICEEEYPQFFDFDYGLEPADIELSNDHPCPGETVTITAHVPFGAILGATPDGRKAGEPVAEGVSPSQGSDRNGPTASLISISRTRASGYKERAARLLNMKLTPSAVEGTEGTKKLMSLIRTACDLKMWHLQFNIINRDTLVAAKEDPEKYRDLLVRVAGYSAYFVDLSSPLQDEIIHRTAHSF